MSEETKTKTIGGAGGVQRSAESEIIEQIKRLEALEAALYAARGHGGYIETQGLETIRQAKANFCAQLADGHTQKAAEAKERARRTGR